MEHDRQAKWPGQAVYLGMENLGVLMGQNRLLGQLDCRLDQCTRARAVISDRAELFVPSPTSEPDVRLLAVRRATPYSQFASRLGSPIEGALRARTRKTVWKASSAWCRSPSRWRQMSRTIGPCRLTSAAKAASPAASCAS